MTISLRNTDILFNDSTTQSTAARTQFIGTAADKAIRYNAQTISENITISSTQNALSAGPITLAAGYIVTVESGGNWVIV